MTRQVMVMRTSRAHDDDMNTRRFALLIEIWSLAVVAFGLAAVTVPWVRDTLFAWMATGDTSHTADFDGNGTFDREGTTGAYCRTDYVYGPGTSPADRRPRSIQPKPAPAL